MSSVSDDQNGDKTKRKKEESSTEGGSGEHRGVG